MSIDMLRPLVIAKGQKPAARKGIGASEDQSVIANHLRIRDLLDGELSLSYTK